MPATAADEQQKVAMLLSAVGPLVHDVLPSIHSFGEGGAAGTR